MDNTTSPLLESLSSWTMFQGDLILYGQRFDIGTSAKISLTNKLTGKVTEIAAKSYTATQIVGTLPPMEAGTYIVRAQCDPVG